MCLRSSKEDEAKGPLSNPALMVLAEHIRQALGQGIPTIVTDNCLSHDIDRHVHVSRTRSDTLPRGPLRRRNTRLETDSALLSDSRWMNETHPDMLNNNKRSSRNRRRKSEGARINALNRPNQVQGDADEIPRPPRRGERCWKMMVEKAEDDAPRPPGRTLSFKESIVPMGGDASPRLPRRRSSIIKSMVQMKECATVETSESLLMKQLNRQSRETISFLPSQSS